MVLVRSVVSRSNAASISRSRSRSLSCSAAMMSPSPLPCATGGLVLVGTATARLRLPLLRRPCITLIPTTRSGCRSMAASRSCTSTRTPTPPRSASSACRRSRPTRSSSTRSCSRSCSTRAPPRPSTTGPTRCRCMASTSRRSRTPSTLRTSLVHASPSSTRSLLRVCARAGSCLPHRASLAVHQSHSFARSRMCVCSTEPAPPPLPPPEGTFNTLPRPSLTRSLTRSLTLPLNDRRATRAAC